VGEQEEQEDADIGYRMLTQDGMDQGGGIEANAGGRIRKR
jgi:hypothetical protein